jgi:Ca-activated chloride channel family protein
MLWMLVILVVPLILFLWWAWRKRQKLITQFISPRLLALLKVGVSPRRQKARLVMLVAAVTCLIIALARPQWGMSKEEARQRGLDIIVAIDTSNSMLAEDASPNRLARAKLAALDLMRRAHTDRLGLIAFAGSAFLECPLTLDDGAFSQSVNALDTKTISEGGTAITECIEEARKAFNTEADSHKVLVIFTDGEDHEGDPITAAKAAAKEGMTIFTVGIGTPEGEKIRIRDERGRVDYLRDDEGKEVVTKLDEGFLNQLAAAANGFYLPLRGTKTMDTLYERGIEPLPKTDRTSKSFQHMREQFHWPLLAAIALLILELFLPERQRRRNNRSAEASTAVETAGAALLLFMLLATSAGASPSSALREYNEGDYKKSLNDYDKLLENGKDDPRLHFNAGDAAYQTRKLDEAVKEFNAALSSPDLKLQERAYYNLGNTLFRAGQMIQEPEKKQESWENAIKQYESAGKLDPNDPDAKFNKQVVEKLLEELKKQQQQQQSQNNKDNKKQDKNQKDQQNQSGNDKQQQQQQQDKSQQQNKQDQSKQDQNSQQKQDQQQQQKQQEQQAKDKQKQDEEKEKQDAEKQEAEQNSGGEDQKKSAEEQQREAAMMAAGQMTPSQAQKLLDSEKGEEKVFQLSPTNNPVTHNHFYKNW